MQEESSPRIIELAVLCVLAALLFACGNGGANNAPRPVVQPAPVTTTAFTISPATATVSPGGSRSFRTSAPATWAIQEGAGGGAISSDGTYTAPASPGVYHVVATAVADSTQTAAASVTVVQSPFVSTGSLLVGRLAHTATLLPNGQVLIAGGGDGPDLIDGMGVITGAELFDLSAGTFTSAGIEARDRHTATLLSNGKVLLTGGETGWSGNFPIVSATADLYDSTSGTFEATGGLATARESHTATLLHDGRILVTGGATPQGTGWRSLASAELYDPSSATFVTASNMMITRFGHTATLLKDGRVLITGGDSAIAELYDPATGVFTVTGSMAASRSYHTATLLPSGKVLVVGGRITDPTAELYDPTTGLFIATGNTSLPRIWHTAALLPNGTVLVAGGLLQDGATAKAEIYDPATGSFALTADMVRARFWHTATLLPGGGVLLVGGADSDDGIHVTTLRNAEIYK